MIEMTETQMDDMINAERDEERAKTAADVLAALKDFLSSCEPGERAGLKLAIQIVESNF
jgi:hypothetical protein